MRLRFSIRFKLLLALLAVTLLTGVVTVTLALGLLTAYTDRQADRELLNSSRTVLLTLELMQAKALADAETMALRDDLRQALVAADRARLVTLTRRVMQERGLDCIAVTDAAGTVLARAHAPDRYGDDLSALGVVDVPLHGMTSATVTRAPNEPLFAGGGAPVFERVPPYRLLGAVVAGYALDDAFVGDLKATSGNDVSLLLDTSRFRSTLQGTDGVSLAGSRVADESLLAAVLATGESHPARIEAGDQAYRAIYTALQGRDSDKPVGVIEIAASEAAVQEAVAQTVHIVLVGASVVGLLAVILAAWLSSRLTRPLQSLARAAAAVGAGDLSQRVDVRSGDELETLGNAFNQMAERLESLREIDRAILAAQSPGETANAALSHLRQLMPCLRASVAVFDFEADEATELAAHANGETGLGAGVRLSLEVPGIKELRQGKVHVVEDILTLSQPTPRDQDLQAEGVRSYITVPLVAQDELIGALNLGAEEPGAFAPEHIEIACEVADQLAIAIQQARLHEQVQRYAQELEHRVAERTAELRAANEEIQQRADELAALYEVGRHLVATLDLEVLLPVIARRVTDTLGGDRCTVFLFDEQTGMLQAQAAHGYMAERLADFSYRPGEEVVGQAYATGEPQYVPDLDLVPDLPRRNAIRAVLAVPLASPTASPLGVLSVTSLRPEAFTPNQQRLLETMAGQIAVAIENARLYEDLQARSCELTASLEELEATNTAMLNVLEDLTEAQAELEERAALLEEAKEQAQEADRLKSIFLATMSHELRTPLNSIIGFTGIMLQGLAGPLNNEQAKQLGMVRDSARHLLNLINDVLDISKIEAGQVEIVSEPFDMREVIEKAVRTVTPLAEKKRLTLVTRVAPEVDQIVSDRRRVEQILINLVNNAVKFTEKGEVRVECQVSDGWLVTRVVDTGIGIKPEDMGKLFEPFRQIEAGLTRRYEGTGLGLSICKRLIEMLGGEIWAESEWGVGSTFTFTLPA